MSTVVGFDGFGPTGVVARSLRASAARRPSESAGPDVAVVVFHRRRRAPAGGRRGLRRHAFGVGRPLLVAAHDLGRASNARRAAAFAAGDALLQVRCEGSHARPACA